MYELVYNTLFNATKRALKSKRVTYTAHTEEELNDMFNRSGFKVIKKLNYNKYRLNNLWLVQKVKKEDKI